MRGMYFFSSPSIVVEDVLEVNWVCEWARERIPIPASSTETLRRLRKMLARGEVNPVAGRSYRRTCEATSEYLVASRGGMRIPARADHTGEPARPPADTWADDKLKRGCQECEARMVPRGVLISARNGSRKEGQGHDRPDSNFREGTRRPVPNGSAYNGGNTIPKRGQAMQKNPSVNANRCLGRGRNVPKQEVAEHTSPSVGGIERTGPRKNVHKWAADSLKSPTVNAGQGNSQECKLG